jgi:hypothetical protein
VACCGVLCVLCVCCTCCGVMWRAVACCGVLWRAVACCGVLWCAVACCGVLWRAVACCGVLWCAVGVVVCGTLHPTPVQYAPNETSPIFADIARVIFADIKHGPRAPPTGAVRDFPELRGDARAALLGRP